MVHFTVLGIRTKDGHLGKQNAVEAEHCALSKSEREMTINGMLMIWLWISIITRIRISLSIFTILFARCFTLSNGRALADRSQMTDLAWVLPSLTHTKSGCAAHKAIYWQICIKESNEQWQPQHWKYANIFNWWMCWGSHSVNRPLTDVSLRIHYDRHTTVTGDYTPSNVCKHDLCLSIASQIECINCICNVSHGKSHVLLLCKTNCSSQEFDLCVHLIFAYSLMSPSVYTCLCAFLVDR